LPSGQELQALHKFGQPKHEAPARASASAIGSTPNPQALALSTANTPHGATASREFAVVAGEGSRLISSRTSAEVVHDKTIRSTVWMGER
jgi:hypothetical protein